jgi:hypothetical protein
MPKKNKDQGLDLYNFVSALDPEKKEVFLKSLSEDERVQFTSSMEEFHQVFGREPKIDYPPGKPDMEKDVSFSEVRLERIKERYDEVMETFPNEQSIDGLKKKRDEYGKMPGSMVKSLDELKAVSMPKVCIKVEVY